MPDTENKQTTREQFPGNSYSSLKQKPKARVAGSANDIAEKGVVKGQVKEKKKSLGEKIAEAFIATDRKDIKEYLIFDTLIPGVKNAIENAIHMLLFNDKPSAKINRSNGESRIRRVGYNSIYDERRRREGLIGERTRVASTELIFDTRADAEEVLVAVEERIEEYGFATVKYFYSLADMTTDFTQTKWGWRDVDDADIIQTREGYLLKMPKPELIG